MEYSSWVVVGVALATALYLYNKHKLSYWERRGVPGPRPNWFFGNLLQNVKLNMHTAFAEMVQQHGKVIGGYIFFTPIVSVADPELIKQILVKDFQFFTNRFQFNAIHELWDKNLFSANDENWKRLRMITSPSFSSGKLRGMSGIMSKSVDKLNSYFYKMAKSEEEEGGVIEVKRTMAGFTTDVIASTSFATETDANEDPNNPFVANGRAFFDIKVLRSIAILMLPSWALKFLNIKSLFLEGPFQFFVDVSQHILEQRRSAGSSGHRHDLVQLLMDATVDQRDLEQVNYEKMTVGDEEEEEEGEEEENNNRDKKKMAEQSVSTTKEETSQKRKLTDNEIIANCVFFFVAGFETTASTLSHLLFELARNPDIQERLYAELEDALHGASDSDEFDSQHYFEEVNSGRLVFLEAVIKETLRKYSPVCAMNRVCSEDGYQLGPVNLFKGQMVNVLTSAVHLSPEYYPEPFTFNPERFLPENKHQLVPYTYLPFSVGPRNCIAMRFAYQELRLCVASIVRRFRFQPTAETPAELKFKPGSGLLIADPFPLRVVMRKAG